MELTARTSYQMGKSPILPLFAASIGAGAGMSGAIIATSAATGLITSPLIGALSDRYGRFQPLLLGTLLFAFTPLVYLAVQTPAQLIVVRLGHGLATAIYGPIITAAVADSYPGHRGEAIGWYRSARTASYILGPALGGAVLLYSDPRTAWVAVGVLGCLGFIPGALLAARLRTIRHFNQGMSTRRNIQRALSTGVRDPVILKLGIAQIALYASLRANSAFLPLWAIAHGLHPSQIGLILGGQVLATLLAQPITGRLASKIGDRAPIGAGLLLVGFGLVVAGTRFDLPALTLAALSLGIGEAAIAPVVSAAATRTTIGRGYGGRLGLLEATDNIGKVLGPLTAGLLIATLGHTSAYVILACLVVAVSVAFFSNFRKTRPGLDV